MLPSLLVAAAVTAAPGAPIPKDAVPNTTGPAPRIVAVKADGSGSVWITAQVWEKRKVQQQFFVIENGQQVMKQQEVEQNFANHIHKSIADFGGKFTTADGTVLTTEQATKRVKDGATLLVTADGKPVDKGWLRAVGNDTVVMIAEGLAHAHFQYNQYNNQGNSPLPTTAAPRLAMLCTDDAGAVKVDVNPNGGNAYSGPVYYDDFGRGRMIRGGKMAMQAAAIDFDGGYYAPQTNSKPGPDGKRLLSDVKFDAYDTTGKLVPRSEAIKRLQAGGLVLLAGDNKFPDAEYLKAFREDVMVLVSGEFVFPQGQPNPYDMPVKSATPAPRPGKPAPPAPAIGIIAPAARIQPAVIKRAALPAVDLPAPKAEAKPEAKPTEKPAEKSAAKTSETPAKPAEKRD